MTQPSQNPNIVVPALPPVIRTPADDSSIQATNQALANLIALLGNPAQDGSIANVLQQLAQFGAQPWVPNVLSAGQNLAPPGILTLATPAQAYRVWGGYVTGSVRTNGTYTGTDGFYARLYVAGSPQISVAHIELSVAGANQHDSNSNALQIPGTPIPAGTPIKLDVNGAVGLGTTGVIRATANIIYSIP